jgi:methyltransferase (TIGR00027 family)
MIRTMTELVRNVSDTARWVATYRARESARKGALFSDPFADRMAGERGRAIANAASRDSEWAIVTRTKLIDDVVRDLLAEGTDAILNLAAGFDTRPYRLALPEGLRWVEADLPELIAEKEQLLAAEKPRCRLERVAVDLADAGARASFLDRYTEGARRAAVLTEGLVIYLEPNAVAELGRTLLACPRVSSWVLDFYSPRTQAEISNSMRGALANAPFKFAPTNGLAFFEALGWKTRVTRSLFHEGVRLKRVPLLMRPFALLPEPNPRDLKNGRWSAVVRFDRS